MESEMCRAGHAGSPNYGKPHVPVAGVYDGAPRASCLFCGKWMFPHGNISAPDPTEAPNIPVR